MTLTLHLLLLLVVNCLLTASIGLVAGVGGIAVLNAGAFLAVGAYSYGIATAVMGWAPAVAFIAATIAGACAGTVVSLAVARLDGEHLVLGTLVVQLVGTSIVANSDRVTGGIYGLPGIRRLGWQSGSLPETAVITIALAVAGLLAVFILYGSPFARAVRAMRDAPLDAVLLGRSPNLIRRRAFVCAATGSAVAGALLASYFTYLDPTMIDVSVSVTVLAAVIIGGAGTFAGAIAGAALMTLTPEALRYLPLASTAAPALQQIFFGGTLVACMLWRPQGILGEYRFKDQG